MLGRLPAMSVMCGRLGGVQLRNWESAGARPTMITPAMSATMPQACRAISPGVTWTRSPKISTPSRIPTMGSPAEIAGSETCRGPALNALCISQIPVAPAPTSA
jgi:hypothetical protein